MSAFVMSQSQELSLLPQIMSRNIILCKPRLVTKMRIIKPESKDSTLDDAFWRPGSLWLQFYYVLQSPGSGAYIASRGVKENRPH